MTKIKNFRVTLRGREMARWLKKERGLEITPEIEATIEEIIKEAKKWVSPAAIYTTLTRQTAEKTTTIPLPAEAVALSAVAVSIGTGIQTERKAAEAGSQRDVLLEAVEQEALVQAIQFTVRLITDQAEEENCDMSAPVTAQDSAMIASLSTLLSLSRIGVELDPAAPSTPPHVRVSYWFWTPTPKGTSRRAREKVAA